MARFRVEVPVAAPLELVWARLTDWPAHAQLAPLTTIRVFGSGDEPGSGFVARTGIGPLAFDDPMEIEEFVAPGRGAAGGGGAGVPGGAAPAAGSADVEVDARAGAWFRVRKTGWAVRGWIVAELWPGTDASGHPVTRLVWTEEIRVPPEPLTRLGSPLIAAVAKAGYGAALRKLGRQVEKEFRG